MRTLFFLLLSIFYSAHITAQTTFPSTFPLSVSENGRYLQTAEGKPYLVLADTAWAIFSGVSKEDVLIYLDDRQAKGFNTVLSSALHFWPDGRSTWEPKQHVYGWQAFDGESPYDLTQQNKMYWDHVEWVVIEAAKRNLYLMIVPCWYRYEGGGWYHHLNEENAEAFGTFLAERFGRYDHIAWMLGGDHRPEERLEATVILGKTLKRLAPHQLISYHANGLAGPSSQWFGEEEWFDFSTIQTHRERHPREYLDVQNDYRSEPILPTWNSEPRYEHSPDRDHEGKRIGAFLMRQQAYRGFLSGGFGVAYGAFNLFNMGFTDWDWKQVLLPLPGAFDMGHFKALMLNREWYELQPDDGDLLVQNRGEKEEYIPCSVTTSKTLAIAYFPKQKPASFDLSKLHGPINAYWFDPSNGAVYSHEGMPFAAKGVREFIPPNKNSGGDEDFVLVLQTHLGIE